MALGRALVERGHNVVLIGDPEFQRLAISGSLPFVGVAFDTRAILIEEQETFARTGNALALLRGLSRRGAEMARAWAKAAIPACRGADLILAGGGAIYMALSLAEAGGQQVMQAMLQPFFPTGAFPSPIVPPRNWPRAVNRLSHQAMLWLFYVMFRKSTNLFRVDGLGLRPWPVLPPPAVRRPHYRALCAVSPTIVPPPRDMPDWVEMTGYWFLDQHADWSPEPALAAFLAAGPPPLYVGFGSMTDTRAAITTQAICDAMAASGQRAVLARGWGGIAPVSDPQRIHVIDEAPHDRLLPLCAGILHHGGAGTLAAAFRAGLPQILAPVMADQPFWADRAARLGTAAAIIPRKTLTAGRLAAAVNRLVQDHNLRRNAARIARRIAEENGLEGAVARIEVISSRNRDPR